MSLFKSLFGKSSVKNVSSVEHDFMFDHILTVFFAFQKTAPDRIISFLVYPSYENKGYVAFDIEFIFDGNINWYRDSNATNELLEWFRLIESDGHTQTFKYTHNTYKECKNMKQIISVIHSYIRQYMMANPSVKFELTDAGGTIRYW